MGGARSGEGIETRRTLLAVGATLDSRRELLVERLEAGLLDVEEDELVAVGWREREHDGDLGCHGCGADGASAVELRYGTESVIARLACWLES